MSTYDDASLVMIPSGYKIGTVFSQKPMSTDGQLTFTRSNDTATRVASNGLIEKVRTNLVLQSETFDNASWNKSLDGQVTITANAAAAPNGTTTADKMIPSAIAGFHCVQQQVTLSAGEASVSVYAKAAENSFLQIFDALTTEFVNFNLTTGVVGSSSAYVGSIEDAGNGWYRCKATKVVPSGTFSARIGVVTTATAVRGQSFTGNGTDGLLIWGAQAETGVATDYIPTTTAAVSVGPVANLPRIDYTGGGCGKLLLEPQRTNLVTYSEQIDNGAWAKTSITVTANTTISPDGLQNADSIEYTGSGNGRATQTLSLGAGTYTASVYAKLVSGTGTFRIFLVVDGATQSLTFTPTNEWERYTFTVTAATGLTQYQLRGSAGTPTVAFWGAQIEAGAYVTSYIPTLGAAVTRGTDSAYKASISTLIGQTEGVAFIDFVWNGLTGVGSYPRIIELWSDSNNHIQLYTIAGTTSWDWEISNGGTVQFAGSSTMALGRNKIAIGYKLNDMVIYKNGTLVASDTSCTVPATSALGVAGSYVGSVAQLAASVNQTLLFKTRLSNSELVSLTTL